MELVFFPWSWRRRSWKPRSVEEQWWSVLGGEVELAWSFKTSNNDLYVGANAQEKFRVLSFRVKIQGLALIGCACQCFCWRHCFESEDFLQGEYLRSMIGRRQRFLHCFLLEGVAYGEADLLVLSWWCQCCYFKFSISVSGLFFFYISFSFFCCVHPLFH
jgi:hypothetical protein